jgi:rubrerythrin
VEISARELRQLAGAVDARHRDAMRTFREETAEVHLGVAGSRRTRAQALTDVDIAVYAESVELAAVAVYGQAATYLSAATRPVGELFAKHHQDHAAAFGALAGDSATGTPNAALVAAVTPALQAIKDEAGALELAFVIENQASATYAFALTVLTIPGAIAGTATILPIESEHAAVLGVALAKAPADLFPNGAFEAASVGEAGNPKTGLDPAKYPVG